jgi:hypothetical protein
MAPTSNFRPGSIVHGIFRFSEQLLPSGAKTERPDWCYSTARSVY